MPIKAFDHDAKSIETLSRRDKFQKFKSTEALYWAESYEESLSDNKWQRLYQFVISYKVHIYWSIIWA